MKRIAFPELPTPLALVTATIKGQFLIRTPYDRGEVESVLNEVTDLLREQGEVDVKYRTKIVTERTKRKKKVRKVRKGKARIGRPKGSKNKVVKLHRAA